jgi:hypothetical protein
MEEKERRRRERRGEEEVKNIYTHILIQKR